MKKKITYIANAEGDVLHKMSEVEEKMLEEYVWYVRASMNMNRMIELGAPRKYIDECQNLKNKHLSRIIEYSEMLRYEE